MAKNEIKRSAFLFTVLPFFDYLILVEKKRQSRIFPQFS